MNTKTKYIVPEDIRIGYNTLKAFYYDLTDVMKDEVKEWIVELRNAIRDWKRNDEEPNWYAFREAANEICREDGMPLLFEDENAWTN